MQAPRFSPVRALVHAAPPAGTPRHDFFADVMHGMLRAEPPTSTKCGPGRGVHFSGLTLR